MQKAIDILEKNGDPSLIEFCKRENGNHGFIMTQKLSFNSVLCNQVIFFTKSILCKTLVKVHSF